jgi:hypothetical protein
MCVGPSAGVHFCDHSVTTACAAQAIELLSSSITGIARTLRHFSFQHNAPTPLLQLRQLAFFSRLATLALADTPCIVPSAVATGLAGTPGAGGCQAATCCYGGMCGGPQAVDRDPADGCTLCLEGLGCPSQASRRVAALPDLQRVVVSSGDPFGDALAHALAPGQRSGCVVIMV